MIMTKMICKASNHKLHWQVNIKQKTQLSTMENNMSDLGSAKQYCLSYWSFTISILLVIEALLAFNMQTYANLIYMSYEHKEFTFSVLHSVYLSNFIIRNSCQNKVSKNHFLLKWSTDDCNLRSLLYLTTSFLFIFYDSLLQTSLTLYNSQAPTLSCFNNEEFSWGLESILLLRIACLFYFSISEYKLSIKLILNFYFKRQYFLSWQSGGAKKSCKIFPLIANSNIYTSGHYFWWKLTTRTVLGMYALVPSLSFAMPVCHCLVGLSP